MPKIKPHRSNMEILDEYQLSPHFTIGARLLTNVDLINKIKKNMVHLYYTLVKGRKSPSWIQPPTRV